MIKGSHRIVKEWTKPRAVLVLTALLLVVLWLSVVLSAIAARSQHIETHKDLLRRMNHAVGEQTRHQLDLAAVFLVAAEHFLNADRSLNPRSDPAFHDLIDELRLKSGHTIALHLVDADGTTTVPGERQSGALVRGDPTAVFKGARTASGIFIGHPFENPLNGRFVLPIGMPLSQPVDGIHSLLAVIDLSALSDAYEEQRQKPGGTIALVGRDGVVFARAPDEQGLRGQAIVAAELIGPSREQQAGGTLLRDDPAGTRELVSYSAMADYPLLTMVAEDYDTALAPWLRQTFWIVVLAVGVSVPVVVVAFRSLRLLQLLADREEQLSRLSTTDRLTGASSRQHFVAALDDALTRVRRYQSALALVLFKIDFFQRINDGYGHAVGDQALVAFADVARGRLRDVDQLGRLGAGEFAILLPGTTVDAAAVVAERVRREITQISIETEDGTLQFTTSASVIGVGGEDTSVDDLLKRAAQTLHEAMAAGHDRVVLA